MAYLRRLGKEVWYGILISLPEASAKGITGRGYHSHPNLWPAYHSAQFHRGCC